ncbi:hypothetical protein GBA52_016606 [Prunus armeniaca]|nr:hypothetical protein GBA52_016606 [Prunus armeniaca]
MQGAHGSSTRIWMDKWILHLYGNRVQPVLRAKLNMDMNVEDIIDHENGIWNLAPIRHLISAEEENAILNTPFGSKGASDLLIWLSERNGRYSVRSRYHWLQSRISSSSLHSPSISSTTTPKLWKLLWKIQALGRSPLCQICSPHPESIEHILLLCRWMQGVWFRGNLNHIINHMEITSLWHWLHEICSSQAS